MRKSLILAAVLVACLTLAPVAAGKASRFGFMFPGLPAFTDPTSQQLADLAQTQLDPGTDGENNPAMGSGFTYFGQFIDHDLTLDTLPQPSAPVDPRTLSNGRTFRFDLDSVYGNGPAGSPQLYEADGEHFRVQDPNPNGVRDLPRNPDGSAVLVEGRNDENELISQLHVAFLKAHNRLVDEGMSFAQARRTLTLHYQWAVVHDYLPHIVGQATVDRFLHGRQVRGDFKPQNPNAPMTPVEFSVAAFRFGHSQVRPGYELNETSGIVPVFSFTDPDLRGGRELPAGNQINWGNFFPELAAAGDTDGGNISRKIDTLISQPLFRLPIPGAEASGSNVLAFRNMLRAKLYGMPSGQTVAREIGIPVITPASLNLGAGFEHGTPLWYYILAESARNGGSTLGPVGGRIVADVMLHILAVDQNSFLNRERRFTPDPEIAGEDGAMTISDLLVFAGVVDTDEPAAAVAPAAPAAPLPAAPAPDPAPDPTPTTPTTPTTPITSDG